MCAEYAAGPPSDLIKLLLAVRALKIHILCNRSNPEARVFPRGLAPILVRNAIGEYELIDAEFSLIPSWWDPDKSDRKTKTGRPVFATHNARLETIAEKPTFKESFLKRHCLVPILDFYESSLFGESFAGNRIKLSTGSVLLAAGCFSEWTNKQTGEVVVSYTIITHLPNRDILAAGHDRMPVFLNPLQALSWLEQTDTASNLKQFLTNSSENEKLKLKIEVDRELKPGWEKNSPSAEEINELKKIVLASGSN